MAATKRNTKGSLCLDFFYFSCSPFSYVNLQGSIEEAKHVISIEFYSSIRVVMKLKPSEEKRLKFLPLVLELAPKSQSHYWFRNSWDRGEEEHLLSECTGSGTTEPCTWVTSFNLHSNPEELSLLHSGLWMKTLTQGVYTLLYSIMPF